MHPLDGPRLKVRCAIQEIDAFERFEEAFGQKAQYKIVRAEFNPKTTKYAYRVLIDSLPPLEIGVLIGEIGHNLRSALDSLVYQLALLETDTPASNIQFPIFLVGRTTKTRPNRKGNRILINHFEGDRLGDGRNMIRDLRPEHQAAIERLQPYKRRRRARPGARHQARGHVLYLLKEINNADKHRSLQVVGVKPRRFSLRGSPAETSKQQGEALEASSFQFAILEDGAKVGEAAASVEVKSKIVPKIAFWKGCPSVQRLSVGIILRGVANHVSQIVESFGPEFS